MFEYMYGMMEEFGPRMDRWARGDLRHVDNEDDDVVRVSNQQHRLEGDLPCDFINFVE